MLSIRIERLSCGACFARMIAIERAARIARPAELE
jgi:hypothetical protein